LQQNLQQAPAPPSPDVNAKGIRIKYLISRDSASEKQRRTAGGKENAAPASQPASRCHAIVAILAIKDRARLRSIARRIAPVAAV
jgi:hypothetical protein